MENELIPTDEEDERRAILSPAQCALLWAAICEAAKQLSDRPRVCLSGSTTPIRSSDPVPTVDWQLAEALALLCVMLNAGAVHAQSIYLFAKISGVTIAERGRKLHLWYQAKMRGHVTNMDAIPDIAVTLRPERAATGGNIQRVIEVKRVLQLGAPTVRQEFGKALDLNVRSYCLLTYNPIRPKISAGANKFGLDVAALFIARGMTPEQLVSHVCEKLEKSRKEERFPAGLKTRYEEYQQQQITFNP